MSQSSFAKWSTDGQLSNESLASNFEKIDLTQGDAASQIARCMGVTPVRASKAIEAIDAGLIGLGLVNGGPAIGTESLSATSQSAGAWDWVSPAASIENLNQDSVLEMLRTAGVPKYQLVSKAREVGQILSSRSLRNDSISSEAAVFSGQQTVMPLSQLTGASAYRFFQGALSNESFGASINTVQADVRLSVLVSVLQSFTSTIDRLFFRVTNASNIVVVKIENAVAFDLDEVDSAPSMSNPTANNSSLYTPIINFYADPDKVNTTPQKVMDNLNVENDTGAVKQIDQTTAQLNLTANSTDINLFALVRDEARLGYQSSNHTDMIAEGGKVGSLRIQATNAAGTSELFDVVVEFRPDAAYIPMPNNEDSGDSMASLARVPFVIDPETLTVAGTTTTLFSGIGTAALQLLIGFNSRISLKYGTINGSGNATPSAVPGAGYNAVSAAGDMTKLTTLIGTTKFSIVSYRPHLTFNEENLRKTTLGVRTNILQKQFEIPQSRFVTCDIACDQEREVESIKAMQTVLSIGNSDRGLKVMQSKLQDMAAFNKAAQQTPSIYSTINPTSLSFAATRCRPFAIDYTLDFTAAGNTVRYMRESEKLSDKHAKVKQILLNTLSNIMAQSLYLVNLAPGETPVFKILAHTVTCDLLLSIPEYHEILFNRERIGTANGSDYSFYLDNGYRVDIIKTYFEEWRDLMAVVPVREQDPTDIVSFATNQTRGAFAGTIPGVSVNGATAYRAVATDRVIPMVTNPTGALIRLKNLDFDIGNLGLTATNA